MPSESEPHLVNKGHVAFCFDVLSAQYYSGGSTEAPFKPFVRWVYAHLTRVSAIRTCLASADFRSCMQCPICYLE